MNCARALAWRCVGTALMVSVLVGTTGCLDTFYVPLPAVPVNSPTPTAQRSVETALPTKPGPIRCAPAPLVAPTVPAQRPGYAQVDPVTGLHVTGNAPELDPQTYRLEVSGLVDHRLMLSLDELRCMPRIESRPDLICPGFFEDLATWAGASLKYVLELAGVQEGATRVQLRSADGYVASATIAEALQDGNLLAYEWEGEPVPVLHGFPLRAVFPGLAGGKWVKWLIRIEVM